MSSVVSIGIGAILGAIFRWKLGVFLNHFFPTLPLGTLIANLLGCFIMGSMIFFTTEHAYFSYEIRLAVITGFLGSLTTFSTFSSEAFMLLTKQDFLWFFTLIGLHVGGTICMVGIGYLLTKTIYQFF